MQLGSELKSKSRAEGSFGTDLEELLLCPVCLDIAKPPLQVGFHMIFCHLFIKPCDHRCGSVQRVTLSVDPVQTGQNYWCAPSAGSHWLACSQGALFTLIPVLHLLPTPGTVPWKTSPGGHFHERQRQPPWQQLERGREVVVKGVKLEGPTLALIPLQGPPLEVLQEEVVDSQGQAEQEGGSSLLARSFFSHKRVWLTFTQVDQNIDFRYLLAPRTDPRALLQATPGLVSPPPPGLLPPGLVSASSDEEGGYDLTSEVFLENVDDEFMPNFPQPDAAVRSGAGSGSTRWAIFQFISVLCVAQDTIPDLDQQSPDLGQQSPNFDLLCFL